MEAKAEGKQLKSMITEFFRSVPCSNKSLLNLQTSPLCDTLVGTRSSLGFLRSVLFLISTSSLGLFLPHYQDPVRLVVVLYSEILDMGGGERKLQFKCWDSARSESRKTYGTGWFTLLAASLSCTGSLEWAWGSGGRGGGERMFTSRLKNSL